MLVKLYEENTNERELNKICDLLRSGGIIIYPTDTVYSIACDIKNIRGIEKIAKIKGVKFENANFSIICNDLSNISEYAKLHDKSLFKLLKRNLPGPFTFILNASNNVPKIFKSKKKTIGIRVPNNNIALKLVENLGNPIVSSSIHDIDDIVEYSTDPELIYERYCDTVDIVIDGGPGGNIASAIIDCTGDEFEILREGEKELI